MECRRAAESVIFQDSAARRIFGHAKSSQVAGWGRRFPSDRKGLASVVSKGSREGVYAARCPLRQRSRSRAIPSTSVKKSGDSGADSGISSLFFRALLMIFPAIENNR